VEEDSEIEEEPQKILRAMSWNARKAQFTRRNRERFNRHREEQLAVSSVEMPK